MCPIVHPGSRTADSHSLSLGGVGGRAELLQEN